MLAEALACIDIDFCLRADAHRVAFAVLSEAST